MYKNILFVLLIVIAGVGAVIVFSRGGGEIATQPTPSADQVVTEITSELYQEKNGIEVTIENVEQRDDTTVLTLGLSNHRYDLAQDSIYESSTLNGATSVSHTILSDAIGGHHVEAEVVFDRTDDGSFQITPVAGTTITFDDLW